MNVNEKWNKSVDQDTVTLVVCPLCKSSLEGKTHKDRDLITRATWKSRISTNKQYEDLSKTLSNWGYCLETPMDFNFAH
jgi:uncharacterized protein YbaR (Trm112 family)